MRQSWLAMTVATLVRFARSEFPTMSLHPARSEVAASGVGPLLIFAGGLLGKEVGANRNASDAVDMFDMASGGNRSTLRLSAPRAFDGGQNAATVCRGKLFIAGGAYANGSKSDLVDVFDLHTRRFESPLRLSSGRSFIAVTALETAGLVFFGGGELSEDEAHPERSKDSDVVDIWSVDKKAWLTPGKLSLGRKKLAATTHKDTIVMFAGGFRSNMGADGYRAEVDMYDVSTGRWSKGRLAEGRMRLAAASSGDCSLFAGGEVNTTNNDGSGIVDVFCDGVWTMTELSIRRYELSAATLNGKIYFGGGNGGVRNLDPMAGTRVDIFDSAVQEWSHVDLPSPRDRLGAAATEAMGGLVCFSGGIGARLDCLSASGMV